MEVTFNLGPVIYDELKAISQLLNIPIDELALNGVKKEIALSRNAALQELKSKVIQSDISTWECKKLKDILQPEIIAEEAIVDTSNAQEVTKKALLDNKVWG